MSVPSEEQMVADALLLGAEPFKNKHNLFRFCHADGWGTNYWTDKGGAARQYLAMLDYYYVGGQLVKAK